MTSGFCHIATSVFCWILLASNSKHLHFCTPCYSLLCFGLAAVGDSPRYLLHATYWENVAGILAEGRMKLAKTSQGISYVKHATLN